MTTVDEQRFTGTSIRRGAPCWSVRVSAGGSCVPTAIFGAPAGSCMLFGANGMWRSYSVGQKRVAWRPGVLRTSGPTDSSLRLHTFATVIGLALVSLVRLKFGGRKSVRSVMKTLSDVKATLVRVRTKARGRRATVMLGPDLSAEQRKAVHTFELGRWMPILLSSR